MGSGATGGGASPGPHPGGSGGCVLPVQGMEEQGQGRFISRGGQSGESGLLEWAVEAGSW